MGTTMSVFMWALGDWPQLLMLYSDYFTHQSISTAPIIYKYDINFSSFDYFGRFTGLGYRLRITKARIGDVYPNWKYPWASGKVDAQINSEWMHELITEFLKWEDRLMLVVSFL